MSLDEVVDALKDLCNEGSDSDHSNSSEDSLTKCEGFFCVEDSFSAKDVDVSVKELGPLNYPITEDVIERLIEISEKAKFGKGLKTVLDTSYRDTQTIPANKLIVEIDQLALDNLLQRIGHELKIEEHSKLEIHLYNMLIYGPGQFFKRHQDTEKVPNMIATLVMVLPSPHKGGDLIIQHHSLKHKFFGSINHEIIKCIAFYSDCFHEVKKVEEGYRIALTYNVELKSGPMPDLLTVDENLKDAVNSYFEESESDMLVYFLDHQYTEHSLRWYMLKGFDRICAKALLAVGKLEGYPPCLALAEYHESWPEGCKDNAEKDTELYFWIDDNNIHFDSKKISVSEDQICFLKDTKEEFDPYKREEEGNMGNYAGNIDEWYHRSAVVLWRDTLAFLDGYKREYRALHELTAQTGMESVLLKKITDNSQKFFSSPFWDDASLQKMALEIMIYLNNNEITSKILSKLKPSDVLDLAKNEVVSWIATNCDLETWKTIVKAWERTHSSDVLLQNLLSFLWVYMAKEDKDVEVAEYLLYETSKFFMNPKKVNNYSYLYDGNHKKDSSSDKQLCSLLQISFQLGKLDLEKELLKKIDSKSSASSFKMFEEALHPDHFARISGDLLLNMTNAVLEKTQQGNYIYAGSNKANVQEIFSLLKTCAKMGNAAIEQKILNHIVSNADTFASSFYAFEEALHPEQFAKISGSLLSSMTNAALEKTQKEKYIHGGPNQAYTQEICSILKTCAKMGNTTNEQKVLNHIVSNANTFSTSFPAFKEALHPEQFARISGTLFLSMANAVLRDIQKEKYVYGGPNQNSIQEICSLLKTSTEMGNTAVEQKILNHIMSNPNIFTPLFLADLLVKIQQLFPDHVSKYTNFKNLALSIIQVELEKLKNPNDCSLQISLSCNCQFCSQVQRFLASATSMQLVIPTAEHNRKRICNILNPMTAYLPIKLETIRTGSPFKLCITKLPTLLQDRQNFMKRLMQTWNRIVNPVPVEHSPAAKKTKTQ